jgi:methylated-DNA-[protein]-cysteine S-methyltransferase
VSAAAIRCATAETALGAIAVAVRDERVCFTSLGGDPDRRRVRAFARAAFDAPVVEAPDDAALVRAVGALGAWGEGARTDFDLELELVGSAFERRVWEELRRIAYGGTATYGEIAERCGAPGGSRAVGRANGRNPVPILVPCHRVVAADGLGGFTGGLDWKVRLLDHERTHAGVGQGLLGFEPPA